MNGSHAVRVFALCGCALALGCSDDTASSGTPEPNRPTYVAPTDPLEGFSEGWTPPATTLPSGVVRTEVGQPGDLTSVCEYTNAWRLHSRHGGNVSVVPQRQYITSCQDAQGTHVFVSMPVSDGDTRSQYVYEAIVDEATGGFAVTGRDLHMPQCQDASGIAAAPDCSHLAVLCHRAYGTSDNETVDRDLVAQYVEDGGDGIVMARDNPVNDLTNTEMWLYEFAAADVTGTPDSYLVHMSVRATETARPQGQYYLTYAAKRDAYAMALRTSMTGDGGNRHVADGFFVIRRGASPQAWTMDPSRGFAWACGRGHTDYNHPGYNAVSDQFAVSCRTDIDGGLYFRTETQGKPGAFHNVQKCCWFSIGGGATTFAAHPDGGFMLAMTSHDPERLAAATSEWEGSDFTHPNWESDESVHPNDVWGGLAPTSVGLARFTSDGVAVGTPDADGNPRADVQWLVHSDTHYLGHPQIADLGNGRYLLGWSEQYRVGDADDVKEIFNWRRRAAFQSAHAYYVMEIDAEGNRLTDPIHVEGAGWGDFDEWTVLGEGKVAWHYIADPELVGPEDAPACGANATPSLFYYASQL